jgi:hypothetical protein
MERLKDIIKFLSDLKLQSGDNLVFSKAIDIYIMEMQEKNKDQRTENINQRSEQKLASFKQINFLKKLGFQGDASKITSQEASKVIEEMVNKKKNKGDEDGESEESYY